MYIILWLFLLAFLSIEIPIGSLMYYLFKRRDENGKTGKLRDIIFVISSGYLIFMFGMAILVLSALFVGFFSRGLILAVFTDTLIIVLITNWYAFFKVRELIGEGVK